jgi:hypothetical protein
VEAKREERLELMLQRENAICNKTHANGGAL